MGELFRSSFGCANARPTIIFFDNQKIFKSEVNGEV